MDDKKLLFCYNCHEYSHIAKNCPKEINSYGIICYMKYDNEIKYLLVERKYSFTYVDFLRGLYNIHDYEYIQDMFNKMTLFERCLIANNSFKYLWNKFWGKSKIQKKSINRIFCKASVKFYILRNGFYSVYTKKYLKTEYFIKNCKGNYKSSEWYFPKGKKNMEENEYQTAIREFKEETNIDIDNIIIRKELGKFIEQHEAANYKVYKVHFFIAEYIGDVNKCHIVGRNQYQLQEIGNIEWLTYKECLHKFRPYEKEKFQLLKQVHDKIKNV